MCSSPKSSSNKPRRTTSTPQWNLANMESFTACANAADKRRRQTSFNQPPKNPQPTHRHTSRTAINWIDRLAYKINLWF